MEGGEQKGCPGMARHPPTGCTAPPSWDTSKSRLLETPRLPLSRAVTQLETTLRCWGPDPTGLSHLHRAHSSAHCRCQLFPEASEPCHCLCKGPSHKCESPEWRRLNPVLLSSPPPPGPRTASSPSQDTSTPTPTSWELGFVPPSPEPGVVHPSPGFALQSGDFWAAVPG